MATIDEFADTSWEDLLAELRSREASDRGEAPATRSTGPLAEAESSALAAAVREQQRVIYGVDDRVDLFEVTDAAVLADGDAVAALFAAGVVTDNGDGTSRLVTQTFAAANNVCPSERFANQPVGAFCSGFLVAPDIVATAGHCVRAPLIGNVRFVFGFRMQDATTATTTVANTQVYRGVAVIGRQKIEAGGVGADWALVRLDRPVPDHRPVPIRRAGKIGDDQAVHVIGHPSGLPTKFADGARVRNNSATAVFVANLDTYGGNSGSPVFNRDTHEVEGILVRGEVDFVSAGSCRVSLVCPASGCRGEDVTRTTVFAPALDGTVNRSRLLRSGTQGIDVSEWQGQLNVVRADLIDVDGIFGPDTDRATRDFQRSRGLAVDGIVGPNTRAAMAAATGTGT